MIKIVKIDPKEFGLEAKSVKTIELAFAPKIAERDGLATIYKALITKEITSELSQEAGDLRRKLVKVRTGIADIHKTQKAFFLASGRFVDAWKNKETLPVEQMEEKLSEIEKYQERIEAEKQEKIREKRAAELDKYEAEYEHIDLGAMDEDVWNNYHAGVKIQYNQRIEAEKKVEADRIAKEKAEAEERERIRKENEQLRKEAEQREKDAEIERKKSEAERQKQEAIVAEEKKKTAKLEADAKILADKLLAKEQADKAENKRIEDEKKAAILVPDKEKLIAFANKLQQLELPKVKSNGAKKVVLSTFELLKKTSNYLVEQSKNL